MAIIFFLLFIGLCIVAGYISLGTIYLVTGAISTAWYKLSGKEAEDKQKDESEFEDIGGGKYRQCKTGRVCEWRGGVSEYKGYYDDDDLVYSEQQKNDIAKTEASKEKARAEGRDTYVSFFAPNSLYDSLEFLDESISTSFSLGIESDTDINFHNLGYWRYYSPARFFIDKTPPKKHLGEILEISAEEYLNYAQPVLEGGETDSFIRWYDDPKVKWHAYKFFRDLGFIKYENYHFIVDQDRIDNYVAEQISKASERNKEEIIEEWNEKTRKYKNLFEQVNNINRWGETTNAERRDIVKKLHDVDGYSVICKLGWEYTN